MEYYACSTSSKVWKYDVFLSFRGVDTRRSFVSYLYYALEQKGINAFKDDERLETGKPISKELFKAIEESRFAIVIFSKSYASSRWCLEELEHIIKCRSELDQIVIPIFYDVTPSDVRHQNPSFSESFSQYKDYIEKVERWREAFKQAGKISGYHLQNYKDEADCIKKIVDYIVSKTLQVVSPSPENLVGMKSQIEKVISLLDMESNEVRSVGIWGMGGIGKTEIASVIYEKYRHRFEADCFLGDVGEMYQKRGLTWLQQVLIRKLLGKKMTITSEREGAMIIKNVLRWKKVLVILDDVNHLNQLKLLLGEPEWFGRASRILITARDKHLLVTHVGENNVYQVQLLSRNEALELFRMHAYNRKFPERNSDELSTEVVKYADGLPLALKVLGSSFYGRNKEQWKDIIDRLKKIPNDDILGKLKISLGGLNKDEMRIFLDIACLYHHQSRDYVELVLKCCGIHLIGISYLIEKSLLSYNFKMHNLIREMGENVLREEYANSRIWLPEEIHDLFAGKLKTEKVESLHIPKGYDFEDDPVNNSRVFKKMQNLQVLRIDDGTFCLDCPTTYLPSSLRFIDWSSYPSSSLPDRFEPSHLVGLCLRYNRRLIELCSISKKLSNLKHLDLSGCFALTKTPNFGDNGNLETVNLSGCGNLKEVHPSLGYCRMLTCLDLWGCKKLKKLPEFVSLESLENLDLLGCTSLENFPNVSGDMRRLSKLFVGSPWIKSLPPSFSGLRVLCLKDCQDLQSIPDTIVQNLKSLRISGCNTLTALPSNIFESKHLEKLVVSHCSRLVELPNIARGDCSMHHLSTLTLKSTGIRELPSSVGNLRGLRSLNMQDCNDLVSLPNSLCKLKNLRRLCLFRCKKLEKLPENIGDLQQLKKLDARETAITRTPPSIAKLGRLKKLNFSHEQFRLSTSFVLHQASGLSSLKYLDLSNCNILGGLPEDLGSLCSLNYLNVKGTNIFYLPESINKLLRLCHLNIQFCKCLNELSGELPPNLVELYADDHLSLKSIRDLAIKCTKLQEISISWYGHENTECEPVSTNQVILLRFQQHFLWTSIQNDFHRRRYFLISFPEGRIPESFRYHFINQEKVSIDLNPSWHTDKFLGFSICCYSNKREVAALNVKLVCKSDTGRKHSLMSFPCCFKSPSPSVMCFIYIPFKALWHVFDNKGDKNPNDYHLFEAYTDSEHAVDWGIHLEYYNKLTRWRRKQRVAIEGDCSIVSEQLESSWTSSHLQAFSEHKIETYRGLHLGYESKALVGDHATMGVQNEHKSQNVELVRAFDSPSRKMGNASRKRKRNKYRYRHKKRKTTSNDPTLSRSTAVLIAPTS